jgi:hypothetical protein
MVKKCVADKLVLLRVGFLAFIIVRFTGGCNNE